METEMRFDEVIEYIKSLSSDSEFIVSVDTEVGNNE